MFRTKVVDKIKTHILCPIIFTCLQNCAFYDVMWENTVEPVSPHVTIWRLRIAGWIPKATDTHSKYVIFIPLPCNNG